MRDCHAESVTYIRPEFIKLVSRKLEFFRINAEILGK